jgi:hypothetical protein
MQRYWLLKHVVHTVTTGLWRFNIYAAESFKDGSDKVSSTHMSEGMWQWLISQPSLDATSVLLHVCVLRDSQ